MEMKAPRGTYDILPVEAQKWQYIESIMRQTAACFGYQEIRTPIFEHTELFQRGVGETTDIVSKEMFVFQDKAKRSLALRPEGTASCVRSLIENGVSKGVMPVKWYYSGPMFRYANVQKGRFRQFHQFGVEVFGSANPQVDAEVIILMLRILQRLGLNQPELHVNSVGCPECRQVYREKLVDFIAPHAEQLCRDCQKRYWQNPLRVLDCKEDSCHKTIAGFPPIIDSLCRECRDHYQKVQQLLSASGVAYQHDDKLVRGLDYYTRTAFEVLLPGIGAQSAIGGGGRYDGLVRECGGPDTPGIGFALGMERILLALEQERALPDTKPPCDIFIVAMNQNFTEQAFQMLSELRCAGFAADKDYNDRSSKAQMKHANRIGAPWVLLLGDEEINTESVTLRNMHNSQQVRIARKDLLSELNSLVTKVGGKIV